jgi:NAD(P)H-nitrite reductase large subunit
MALAAERSSGPASTSDERDAKFINDRVHANIQRDGTFSVVPGCRAA